MSVIRLVYLLVNLGVALLQVFPAFNQWVFLRGAAICAFAAILVIGGRKERPACSYLCWFFFMQCMLYVFGIHWEDLSTVFDPAAFETLVASLEGTNALSGLCIYGGASIAIIGFASKRINLTWFLGLGLGLVGLGFILPMWSTGDFGGLKFKESGDAVITAFIFVALYWSLCLYIVSEACPDSRLEQKWLSIILFTVILVVNVSCEPYVASIAQRLKQVIISLPEVQFAWWRVIIASILLYVLAIANKDDVSNQIDMFVLFLFANILLSVRFLMSLYFTYSWVLLLVSIVIGLKSIWNGKRRKKTIRLDCVHFLIYEIVAFSAMALMLCFGLWINVIVTLAFGVLFYNNWEKMKANSSGNFLWISVVTLLISEALARMVSWRYSMDGMILLGIVYGMSVVVIRLINMHHPAGAVPNNWLHAIVATCVCIVCMTSMQSPIRVEADTVGNKVQITTEAHGDNNKVRATLSWRDCFGRDVVTKRRLKKSKVTTPIWSDVLLIEAVDANGVTCKRIFFYAPWMHKFKKSTAFS